MSASREKKTRKTTPQTANKKKGGVTDKSRRLIVITVVSVILVFILVLTVVGSGILQKNTAAVTVGKTSVSPVEFNYYFVNYKWNIYNFYAQYGFEAFDTTKSMKTQMYDEENNESWADYLNSAVVDSLHQTLTAYEQALASGTSLTDEDFDTINNTLQGIVDYAAENDMTTQEFLNVYYGQGITLDIIYKCLERDLLATRWSTNVKAAYNFTDEDVENYYLENRNDYDVVDYRAFSLSGVLDEGTDEQKEAFKASVDDLIGKFQARVTTPDKFYELTKTYSEKYNTLKAKALAEAGEEGDDTDETDETDDDETDEAEDTDDTIYSRISYSSVSGTDAKDWLFDDAREPGDTTKIESSSVYTVYLFELKQRNPDYAFVDARHILVKYPSSTPTDEQKAETLVKAQELWDQWKAGEMTEESFGELAKEKTEDTGSVETNGLYTEIEHGDMVTQFNDWIFNPARKPGDTDIVATTYGEHIMYFVKGEGLYWQKSIRDTLIDNAFEIKATELEGNTAVKTHWFGMFITNMGK